MKTVYLSGPIAHTSYAGCTGWRDQAERDLRAFGIKALSPMRGKDFLKHVETFTQDCAQYSNNPLSSPRGIMTRDFYDSTTCDVMLVNLLGAEKVSIGTVMELAWAYQARTPIVLIIEANGSNIHEHSMIHEAIGYRVTTLEEAVEITRLLVGAEKVPPVIGPSPFPPMFGTVPGLIPAYVPQPFTAAQPPPIKPGTVVCKVNVEGAAKGIYDR